MPSEYMYRVSAWWTSGRAGLAKCESAPNAIHFSEAAELGGLQGRWTPERLVLSALAGCFITTFHDVACAAKFDYADLEVEIEGSVRRSRTNGCNFSEILIRPRLTVSGWGEDQREAGLALLRRSRFANGHEVNQARSATFYHQFSPAFLLANTGRLYRARPRAFTATLTGEDFRDRESLSPKIQRGLPEFVQRIEALIRTLGKAC
jgi:uncharacterized OsmC-like protein